MFHLRTLDEVWMMMQPLPGYDLWKLATPEWYDDATPWCPHCDIALDENLICPDCAWYPEEPEPDEAYDRARDQQFENL